MRRVISTCRRFCSTNSTGSTQSGRAGEQIIRSGGRSSYIGFGKFEGMGSENGDIKKGLEYLKDALQAHTTVEMDPDQIRESARFHHDIGMCHHRDGDVESAIKEYRETIRILEDLLLRCPSNEERFGTVIKRSRFDISSALSGMSVALADIGKDEESLAHALKSLEIRKSLMGANHASVAECLNNLGGLYFRQANYNKAAEMYQESLRILLTKTHGKEENKYVALAYYNIGLTYEKLGIQKGVDAVYKALMIAHHVWGPSHDQTIQIQETYQTLNKLRETDPAQGRAMPSKS